MNNINKEVYLDLDGPVSQNSNRAGVDFLARFICNKKLIGKRYINLQTKRILDNTKSVKLFQQAKDLYCLGLFESTIMISRSTAEYIASELLRDNLNVVIKEEELLKDFIVDSIDFRKIVNDFLYNYNCEKRVITKDEKNNFNKLYDLGNNYIHPKSKSLNPEEDALRAITLLDKLIASFKNILKKYDINGGILVKKTKL